MAEPKPAKKPLNSGKIGARRRVARLAEAQAAAEQTPPEELVEQILATTTLPGLLQPHVGSDPEQIIERYRRFFLSLLKGTPLNHAIARAEIHDRGFREWMRKGGDARHNGGVDKSEEAEPAYRNFAQKVRMCQALAVDTLYGYAMDHAPTDWKATHALLNRLDPMPSQGITAAVSVQTDQDQSKTQVVIYVPRNGREQDDSLVLGEGPLGGSAEGSHDLPPVSAMQVLDAEVIEADITDIDDVPNFQDMPMDEGE